MTACGEPQQTCIAFAPCAPGNRAKLRAESAGTRDAVCTYVRLVGVIALVGFGCTVPLASTEPATATVTEMTNDELEARLVGLRATLSRSGIALDDVQHVDSCSTAHLGDACVRCEVAREGNIEGIDLSMVDSAAIAFSMYPPALLSATRVRHVALCRTIEVGAGRMAPAGMALLGQHRILVNVGVFADAHGDFTIDRVIHHELFHLLDHGGEYFDADPAWAALNPKGFAYADPEQLYREREMSATRPRGFVGSYATQNLLEDRASTFELVVGRSTEACGIAATDPIVAKKIGLIRSRMQKVAGKSALFAPCKKPPAKKRRVPSSCDLELDLSRANSHCPRDE